MCVVQSNDFGACHQYALSYLAQRTSEMQEQEKKLNEQSTACPMMPVPFTRLDRCLKTLVQSERQYLTKRNHQQLAKFKEQIEGRQLYEITTQSFLTTDQVL